MHEIVMSTLDVILAGTRNVSHKNVIIVFGKQLPILLPTRTVKLLLPNFIVDTIHQVTFIL